MVILRIRSAAIWAIHYNSYPFLAALVGCSRCRSVLRFRLSPSSTLRRQSKRKYLILVRNINGQKCHELFHGTQAPLLFSVIFAIAVSLASPVCGQIYRPPTIAPPAPAQTPPAQVNATNPNQRIRAPRPNAPGAKDLLVDANTQEAEGSMRRLRGNVKLETIEMSLRADAVDYNTETGEAEARGNVRFEHFYNGDKIQCDHAKYNIDDETGIFYEVRGTAPAKIQSRPGTLTTSNPFYFEGVWAERVHEKYILHSGFITDCKVPRPWWTLRGPKFDVIPNDRAIAYHSTFRIRGIPLFYAPAFYKSLKKSPRRSGFLTPNIGHSSLRGYMVGGGYFWAINRSYDAMYRAQYFTERGVAHFVDLRGKVRPGTDFNVSMYGVNDRGVKIGESNGQPVIQKQGGLLLDVDGRSQLPYGFEARGHLDYLSSFLFRQSFAESFHEAIFSESRSVGYLTKHWSTFALNLVAERDEQFQSTAPGDNIIIRKLPELQFLSREHEVLSGPLPVWVSFETSAGLLHRTEPDFQTRQFVDRLDFNPRITSALRWKGFSLIPSFAVRETEYGSSFQDSRVTGKDFLRSSREISVELLTPSLARVFKAPKWLGDKMKHVIEPRVEYHFVDGIGDFNQIVRFDQTDILSNTNELRLSVANRLYVKDKNGNVNEVLSWEVSQSRYFDPTFGGAVVAGRRNVVETASDLTGFAFLDGPRNYSPIVSVLRVQQRIGVEWRADYDPLQGHIINSGFTADARFSQYFVSLGDYQVRSDPVLAPNSNQFRGLLGYGNQNRKGWNGAISEYYDFKRGLVQFSTAEVTYNTDCCGISFEYRRFNIGTRDESQYRVAFAVSNIGTFGTLKKQERIF
jgi:LPS-assembly protein